MKRIFIDTNVLLDVLMEREPFCRPAQIVWSLAETKKVQAAISAVSVSNIFFIIKRLASKEKAYEAIRVLLEIFKVCDVTSRVLSQALAAKFSDFEDAVQYFSAVKFGAKAILSRDPSGFSEVKIPIMDCNEYLSIFSKPS